jgi:type IV pilus assembly protein PilC
MFVVPVFAKLYGRMHVPLPAPTQFLITLSQLIRVGWLPGLLALGAATLWGRRLRLHRRVKRWIDYAKLYVPVFGPLNQLVMVSRFIRTFATLSAVGVPLIEAIEVAQVVANNGYWTQIAAQIKESVRAGNPMAYAMEAHEIFPAVVVRMADSGEQAGVLPVMLNKGADFLDKEIDRTVNALLTKLEPTLTVLLGVIIGVMLMSVYLPMFDYMNHMQ